MNDLESGDRPRTEATAAPRDHVLLIGVDAYERVDPLQGAVHDVDALEAVFLDRLSVPAESITKLVAPHPAAIRAPRLREERPTAERIRSALEALAGEVVCPGDRVFIHYSGHGTQVLPRGSRVAREALVPVDALAGGELLFDHDINDVLFRIAERTNDLTVVLDCCCSAGATRGPFRARESVVRSCFIKDPPRLAERVSRGASLERLLSPFDPSDPGFLVVASAQSSEAAYEGRDARGVRHGAFTAALLEILAGVPDDRIRSLRWVDIWQSLRARVALTFPGQHPCLLGLGERRLFGGPFRRQDAGVPVTEIDGTYRLAAGSLVGLSPGASVAVYGPEPPFFPPLHSPEDLRVRLGLLRVESATESSAIASPVGNVFPLASGARARLVKPGRGDELVVGLDPFDPDLARWLSTEAPFLVRPTSERGDREIEVVVGRSSQGRLFIGDDIFGEDAPLAWVDDRASLARGLSHYARYRLPLRLVRRCRDLLGALRIRVLDAREAALLGLEELSNPPLPEVDPDPDRRYRYCITDGQPICFSVENRSSRPMYTHVINCSASGRVELLGQTQLEIAPWRRGTFWLRGHLGRGFPCRISAGRQWNVERLVVVGTCSPDVDLRHMRVKESFAEAMLASPREMLPEEGEPAELWTAASVTVKIMPVVDGS